MMEGLKKHLKRKFLTGLLVVIPIVVTVLVIRFLFTFMDGLLGPAIARLLGFKVPGLGIIATLIIIFLVGLAVTNYLGTKMMQVGESLVARLPLIKTVYSSAKQLVEAIFLPGKDAFKRVVLVEFPRKEIYAVGFVTNTMTLELGAGEKRELASVFIPSVPLPTTGWMLLVPKEDLIPAPFSVETGIRMIISGGVVSPVADLPRAKPLKEWGTS